MPRVRRPRSPLSFQFKIENNIVLPREIQNMSQRRNALSHKFAAKLSSNPHLVAAPQPRHILPVLAPL